MNQQTDEIEGLSEWSPFERLRTVSAEFAHYSSGFLRSRPERWVPNFASQWLTLAHSLGIELRVIEVVPSLRAPTNLGTLFVGSFAGESVGLAFDSESETSVIKAIAPDSPQVSSLALEYVARRLFSSLVMSWNGPQQDKRSIFKGIVSQRSDQFLSGQEAGIKIGFSLDGRGGLIWISLSKALVEQFDGLWKRQVRSTSKMPKEGAVLQVEVAQLGIPTDELSHYVVPGAVVELETPVTDYITLRVADRPWLMSRLCLVGNNFGLEISSKTASEPADVEGVQRVSIRLGDFHVDMNSLSECSQAGAILKTTLPANNVVKLYSNNAVIGRARLQTYGGSFALTVLEG